MSVHTVGSFYIGIIIPVGIVYCKYQRKQKKNDLS